MESRNVEFGYFNYVADNVKIIADAEQIKRVVHNIVNNSLKYMDKPKGKINLRVKDVGDFVQVELEDNGKELQQKICLIYLTVFTGRMRLEIRPRAEAELDFPL